MRNETKIGDIVDVLLIDRIDPENTPILHEKVERAKDTISKRPSAPYSSDVDSNEVQAAYFVAENILNTRPGLLRIVL
ncbi:MAG TPA: hypothetical protein VMV24_02525 [Candidatus Dormibacteraeota bacterium]|nr:hypothetical protein [Candidatus Dormibacteraeota bacterium]